MPEEKPRVYPADEDYTDGGGMLRWSFVSPHNFDGRGPVPQEVTAAAKRIAELRVKYVHQWTPGMENPLTTREVEELFNAAALQAEWMRELYDTLHGPQTGITPTTQPDAMECGRILIRCAALAGRWGHSLSETDLERGAKAVVSDPYYRSDIAGVAQRWASDKGSVDDVRMVRDALDQLVQNDTAP